MRSALRRLPATRLAAYYVCRTPGAPENARSKEGGEKMAGRGYAKLSEGIYAVMLRGWRRCAGGCTPLFALLLLKAHSQAASQISMRWLSFLSLSSSRSRNTLARATRPLIFHLVTPINLTARQRLHLSLFLSFALSRISSFLILLPHFTFAISFDRVSSFYTCFDRACTNAHEAVLITERFPASSRFK